MSTQTAPPIRPDMTMAEIQRHYPSARRALFQRYHVGGCSSCAYQPEDTLEKVCRDHNLLDVPGVVEHLRRSHEVDQRMQVEPEAVQAWVEAGEPMTFLDIRHPSQAAGVPVAGAEPLDFANQSKYMQLPKDTRIVFLCQDGAMALDAAAYFAGHGYANVFAVRGGFEAWRARVEAGRG
ncbi:MAG TPA: rhodanese-like domain-containing protein [Planctomycetota bacterium]